MAAAGPDCDNAPRKKGDGDMGRTQKILLGLILLLAAGVGYLALRNRQPPVLPRDAEHAVYDLPKCQDCHGPAGDFPRSKNHPIGEDCARCHGFPK